MTVLEQARQEPRTLFWNAYTHVEFGGKNISIKNSSNTADALYCIMEDEPLVSFCKEVVKKYDNAQLERPVYVIQEHHASRLHWDLRFEMDDALKSWALPKEPPQKIGERRLAVSVDDHPIEYALFEGEIPKGNYGAGMVKTWDKGTFDVVENSKKKLVINIHGSRLKGKYYLVHFEPEGNNWLFFKMRFDSA